MASPDANQHQETEELLRYLGLVPQDEEQLPPQFSRRLRRRCLQAQATPRQRCGRRSIFLASSEQQDNSNSNSNNNSNNNSNSNSNNNSNGHYSVDDEYSRKQVDYIIRLRRSRCPDVCFFKYDDSLQQPATGGAAFSSSRFGANCLANAGWTKAAPKPLADERFISCELVNDLLLKRIAITGKTITERSLFTPKHGTSAGEALRENAGLLFFTKDLKFDYGRTLALMRRLYPQLTSTKLYVPFFAFVKALRNVRLARVPPIAIDDSTVVPLGLGLLLLLLLVWILVSLAGDSNYSQKSQHILAVALLTPGLAFAAGAMA